MATAKTTGTLPDPTDIFAPVPGSYPFEDQIEDNIARLDAQQAENPVPEPLAEQLGLTAEGTVEPTPSTEPTQTRTIKTSKVVARTQSPSRTTTQTKADTD